MCNGMAYVLCHHKGRPLHLMILIIPVRQLQSRKIKVKELQTDHIKKTSDNLVWPFWLSEGSQIFTRLCKCEFEAFLAKFWRLYKCKQRPIICLFVYFAIIQSTFRLFKGLQYLNNMYRINIDGLACEFAHSMCKFLVYLRSLYLHI